MTRKGIRRKKRRDLIDYPEEQHQGELQREEGIQMEHQMEIEMEMGTMVETIIITTIIITTITTIITIKRTKG